MRKKERQTEKLLDELNKRYNYLCQKSSDSARTHVLLLVTLIHLVGKEILSKRA